MNLIEYKKLLNIETNDNEKVTMVKNYLRTKIKNLNVFDEISKNEWESIYLNLSLEVGTMYIEHHDVKETIINIITNPLNGIKEVMFYYSVFIKLIENSLMRIKAIDVLKECFDKFGIMFEIIKDNDGVFFIPKGSKEMDKALVVDTLMWMNDYPKAKKAWMKALTEYCNAKDDNASEIADLFRKALEAFLKEFFGNNKSLENNISDYGMYLSNNGVPKEISNGLRNVLDLYTKYNNNYAKHKDGSQVSILEYIMYETGNIMRLLFNVEN